MDKWDKFFIIFIVLWFGLSIGGGSYQEYQLEKEIKNVAGEDYIKFHGKSSTGHKNINEIYDKSGNCVGIYWIQNSLIYYKFHEIINVESCEGLSKK